MAWIWKSLVIGIRSLYSRGPDSKLTQLLPSQSGYLQPNITISMKYVESPWVLRHSLSLAKFKSIFKTWAPLQVGFEQWPTNLNSIVF